MNSNEITEESFGSMKKQYKILSAVIAFAILISGCSGESGEADLELTEGEAPTVSSNIASAPATVSSENTPESAEAAARTSKAVQSEKVTGTAAETIPENTYTAEFPPSGIDMSNYSGYFYEWEYDKSIVSENEADFAAEDIKAAYSAANGYFAGLLEQTEIPSQYLRELGAAYILRVDSYDMRWDFPMFECEYIRCMEGDYNIEFYTGACGDFDGDGKEENFFRFIKEKYVMQPLVFTVFVNSEGEACVLKDAGMVKGELFPMRYNGFTHLAEINGYINSTARINIYAVENGEAVLKLTEHMLPENYMDVFMRVSIFQGTEEWLVFWNDEINEYCSVSGDPITGEEAEKLFEAYEQNGFSNDKYTGRYKTSQAIQTNTRKIGNIYCIKIESSRNFFEKDENGFKLSDVRLGPANEEFSEIFASRIDFDTIAEKTVKLD